MNTQADISTVTSVMADELQRGHKLFSQLPHPVSVFGSARITEESTHYADAQAIGYKLGQAGCTIVTGGGPGAMEAANRGAKSAGAESVGIGIEIFTEQGINPYVTESMTCEYFMTRKRLLVHYSKAFIVLPGGIGTFDELFEVITLIYTRKMPPVPVILFGVQFWSGMIDWLREQVVSHGMTAPEVIDSLILTDSIDEAVAIASGR